MLPLPHVAASSRHPLQFVLGRRDCPFEPTFTTTGGGKNAIVNFTGVFNILHSELVFHLPHGFIVSDVLPVFIFLNPFHISCRGRGFVEFGYGETLRWWK